MGSLWAASRIALMATSWSTPSISNSTLPGRTTATHCSGSALAFTHTGFGRLLGDRLVREQPDPHFAAALDRAGHGHAGRFDLPVGDPAAGERLQPEVAESDSGAAPGLAGHAAALLLPVLDLLRHHHGGLLSFRLGLAGLARPAALPASRTAAAPIQRRQNRRGRTCRRTRQVRGRRLHGRPGGFLPLPARAPHGGGRADRGRRDRRGRHGARSRRSRRGSGSPAARPPRRIMPPRISPLYSQP